jgi:TolB protein
MLGGFWIRLIGRLTYIPLILSIPLIVLSGVLGKNYVPSQQVAFMSDLATSSERTWDIYVMDVERHIIDRVTWGPGSERFPAWSPDGKKLAFHSNQRGLDKNVHEFYDLYLIDPDGRNIQVLTENHLPLPDENFPGQGGSSMVAWSPDGTQLGFHTGGGGSNWELAVIDLTTLHVRYLTRDLNNTYGGVNIHFEWSPDGTQVAFSSQRDAIDTGGMDIFLMDLTTGLITRLTDPGVVYNPNNPSPTSEENYPAWSPGGKWIAFVMSRGGLGENIYIMDTDGGNIRPLTDSSYTDGFPVWKPDGSGVVFDSDRKGNITQRQLYIVDLATLTVRQLTDIPASAQAPSWRPAAPAN